MAARGRGPRRGRVRREEGEEGRWRLPELRSFQPERRRSIVQKLAQRGSSTHYTCTHTQTNRRTERETERERVIVLWFDHFHISSLIYFLMLWPMLNEPLH